VDAEDAALNAVYSSNAARILGAHRVIPPGLGMDNPRFGISHREICFCYSKKLKKLVDFHLERCPQFEDARVPKPAAQGEP
jgi:hypothetical protein